MRSGGWELERGDEVVAGCTAIKRLGGGHSYEAYEAFDENMLATVVVKVVRPHLTEDGSTLRGLRREVAMLGRLNHPVIVRGFHAVTDGERPYVALEYLPGPRLSTLIRKNGVLPPEQLLPLAVQLCTALHYMHACGVVHLDVKPSNIIMDATPRLIDLSIARSVDAAAELQHSVGTDRYMAPEQCDPAARGAPGPASDVWGLGATLYEAAAGSRAFVDEEDDPHPQLTDEPLPMPGHVPEEIAGAIMECLARPGDRPSPRDLMEHFAALQEDLPKPRVGFFRPKHR